MLRNRENVLANHLCLFLNIFLWHKYQWQLNIELHVYYVLKVSKIQNSHEHKSSVLSLIQKFPISYMNQFIFYTIFGLTVVKDYSLLCAQESILVVLGPCVVTGIKPWLNMFKANMSYPLYYGSSPKILFLRMKIQGSELTLKANGYLHARDPGLNPQ